MITVVRRAAKALRARSKAVWARRVVARKMARSLVSDSTTWLKQQPQSFPLWQQKAFSRILSSVSLLAPVILHEKRISLLMTGGWVSFLLFKEVFEAIIAGNRDARWTDAERVRAGAIAGAINEVGELLRQNNGQLSQPIDKRVVTSNLLRALEDDVRRLTGKEGSVSMIMALLKPKAEAGGANPELLETISISQNLGPHQFKMIRIDSTHPPAVAYRTLRPQVVPDTRNCGCEDLVNHPIYRSMVAFPITFNGSSGEVIAVAVILAVEAQVFTLETVDRRFEEVITPYLRLLAVLETIA